MTYMVSTLYNIVLLCITYKMSALLLNVCDSREMHMIGACVQDIMCKLCAIGCKVFFSLRLVMLVLVMRWYVVL